MDFAKVLLERGCKVWASTDYIQAVHACAVPHVSQSLYIGFPPCSERMLAVCYIQEEADIQWLSRYTTYFLDMVNNRGGIGFVAMCPEDVDWHLSLDKWRVPIIKKKKIALLTKRFLKKMKTKVQHTICIDENQLWTELLTWVLAHEDYAVLSAYYDLTVGTTKMLYGEFLQYYRSILTGLLQNGLVGYK